LQAIETFWLWTSGANTSTLTLGLDPAHVYLVDAHLTQSSGGDYAHVYIVEICTQSGDQVNCGINDEGSAQAVTFLSQATQVTMGLHTTGGEHKAEGVLYVL
jgi:hypothetical protein